MKNSLKAGDAAVISENADGSLRIARLNSFIPAAGDSFTLMTFASGSGAFTNVAGGTRLKTVDNLGSFLVTLTATSLVASAYLTLDADGDGIEDAWAVQQFGHSPLTTAEKNADAARRIRPWSDLSSSSVVDIGFLPLEFNSELYQPGRSRNETSRACFSTARGLLSSRLRPRPILASLIA